MSWLIFLFGIALNGSVVFEVNEQPINEQELVPGVEVEAKRLTQEEIDTMYMLPEVTVHAKRIRVSNHAGSYADYRRAVAAVFRTSVMVGAGLIFGLLATAFIVVIANRFSSLPHQHRPKPDPHLVYIHALALRAKNHRRLER
jgi:hypothetical protein